MVRQFTDTNAVAKNRSNRSSGHPPNRNLPGRRWKAIGMVGCVFAALAVAILMLRHDSGNFPLDSGFGPGSPTAFGLEDERRVFAGYAGSESCRGCHAAATALWESSHHGLAERLVSIHADGAAFSPAREVAHGTNVSRVHREGETFHLTGPGWTQSQETHAVNRIIGVSPLRQGLMAASGGRWQATELAYDPRTNDWFNVFGGENRRAGEWGHWTGRGMNWNSMCASCHNTRLRKNYDPLTDTYRTTMAEMSVGCESCHGPMKAHVEWQAARPARGGKDPTLSKFTRAQSLDTCGSCHARRGELTGDFKPGDSFHDHFELATVDHSDVFHADGQVREENYEFSSFLGSRMHLKGVHCLDCHQPHSAKPILSGNQLCLRCHDGTYPGAPRIEPAAHSHHRVLDLAGSLAPDPAVPGSGGQCVNCHMPQTVYMQRHARHDHGFTIPDPVLTRELGIPNACNRCHADQSTDWAVEAVERWYGPTMNQAGRQRTRAIAQARRGDATARGDLIALTTSTNEPPYWRAVAVELLGSWSDEASVSAALLQLADDAEPLVRAKAIRALGLNPVPPSAPASELLSRKLEDSVRAVRLNAAWALRSGLRMDSPVGGEVRHLLDFNADQPTGQMSLGNFYHARGQHDRALTHYQRAVEWDPFSAPIRHELAVVLSALERPREAAAHLEAAARLAPHDAEYPFKLALAWNEAGDSEKTLDALETAVRVDSRHARAWYNLGLARVGAGDSTGALDALLRAESLTPRDPSIPYARATVLARLGRVEEARAAAARALEIQPGHPEAVALLASLRR